MFVNLLMDGDGSGTDCTKTQLDAWITNLGVPFSAGRDPDSMPYAIRHTFGERETTYIIERATMKVLAVEPSPPDGLTKLQSLPP
jgi:hypothetical protein